MTSLRVMGRTLFALVLREARVRHGRSRIGYAWSLIEPIVIVAFISLTMSGLLGRRELSYDFGVFYAIAVVNFQYFRHASTFIGHALEANIPLFNYPSVHEMDAALARLILDTGTYMIIGLVIHLFLHFVFDATWPSHPERMLLAFFGLGFLAFGIGLNLAAFLRRFEMTMHVWHLISAPLFFGSALLYSLQQLPTDYRNVLLWNPVVHGIEGYRSGYYPDYGQDYVSFGYLYMFGLVLVASGTLQVLLSRRGMR